MNAPDLKYRLLTRSDMDGLVCAVLLKELGLLDDIVFDHPKDMQDGKVAVTDRDILTNLPYVPGCGMCFDHHASEALRNGGQATPNYILEPDAKSAARVVYDHLRRQGALPAHQRRDDGRGRQGRLGRLQPRRRAEPAGLGAAVAS